MVLVHEKQREGTFENMQVIAWILLEDTRLPLGIMIS